MDEGVLVHQLSYRNGDNVFWCDVDKAFYEKHKDNTYEWRARTILVLTPTEETQQSVELYEVFENGRYQFKRIE